MTVSRSEMWPNEPIGFQQLFIVAAIEFDRLSEALDAPQSANARLRALLSVKPPWEQRVRAWATS